MLPALHGVRKTTDSGRSRSAVGTARFSDDFGGRRGGFLGQLPWHGGPWDAEPSCGLPLRLSDEQVVYRHPVKHRHHDLDTSALCTNFRRAKCLGSLGGESVRLTQARVLG